MVLAIVGLACNLPQVIKVIYGNPVSIHTLQFS